MRRPIIRASLVYRAANPKTGEAASRLCERALVNFPPANRDLLEPSLTKRGQVSNEAEVLAEINHGRWIAKCPFCSGAQVCDFADPLFLCAGSDGCMNLPVDGAYVRIVFPPRRTEIEEALGRRPQKATVNWVPGETVEDLIAENIEHGVEGVSV